MHENPFSHPERAGLYHLPGDAEDLPRQASEAACRLLVVELRHCRDLDAALREIGRAASFPAWYGNNLDALSDCLNDPDWRAGNTTILKISGLQSLRRHMPERMAPLIDVLRTASPGADNTQPPLWILLSDPVRGVASLRCA